MDNHTGINYPGVVQQLPPVEPEVFGTGYSDRPVSRAFNAVRRPAMALMACALFWPFSAFQAQGQPESTTHQVTIVQQAGRIRITFPGALEAAVEAAGPWIEITNATSPWDEEVTEKRKFYRTATAVPEDIFASPSILDWVVTAPFQVHFDLAFAGTPDGIFPPQRLKPYFDGKLQMTSFEIPVSFRVRGNSSLQECPFPKLKFKVAKEDRPGTPFRKAREIKIGTHCAEGGRGTIGRLRDDRAGFREALVYEMMGWMGFTAPQVRRVQIEYRDTSATNATAAGHWQIHRQAFILEDIEVVAERLGGRVLSGQELAALSQAAFDEELVAGLELFDALVGNWDYALSPGGEGLRNTDVLELQSKQLLPVAGDFDLASFVTGEVRLSAPREYRPDLAEVERQAHYQVEQIQARVSPESFSAASTLFRAQRPLIESQINSAAIDDDGRANALRHVTAFFDALPGTNPPE